MMDWVDKKLRNVHYKKYSIPTYIVVGIHLVEDNFS